MLSEASQFINRIDPSFALVHLQPGIQDDKYNDYFFVILNGKAQALQGASEESNESTLLFITNRSFIRASALSTRHSG
jgi:hypothetical protein